MRVFNAKKGGYISLKEAAEISGYSSDYIGQLIRSGKLPGKQIFLNVAWVTTEEALREYLKDGKKNGTTPKSFLSSFRERILSTDGLSLAYKASVWGSLIFCVVFLLFLGYVLAVTVDHRIEQKHLEKLETVSV